jgi:hypothetical protein
MSQFSRTNLAALRNSTRALHERHDVAIRIVGGGRSMRFEPRFAIAIDRSSRDRGHAACTSRTTMKCTMLLRRQHHKVVQLLGAVEDEHYVRGALLEELADEFAAMMTIEEAIFYPAVRQAMGLTLGYLEADHANVTFGLQRLFAAHETGDRARFRAEVGALRTLVCARFEEEERSLYPRAEAAIAEGEQERLGDHMARLMRSIVESDGDARTSSIGRPSRADWYRFDMVESAEVRGADAE